MASKAILECPCCGYEFFKDELERLRELKELEEYIPSINKRWEIDDEG